MCELLRQRPGPAEVAELERIAGAEVVPRALLTAKRWDGDGWDPEFAAAEVLREMLITRSSSWVDYWRAL